MVNNTQAFSTTSTIPPSRTGTEIFPLLLPHTFCIRDAWSFGEKLDHCFLSLVTRSLEVRWQFTVPDYTQHYAS